jgi:hypothetical protein
MGTTSTTTGMKPRHQSNGDTDEIRADIENTRERMDGTLDELSERLKPRHLLDEVLDYFQSRRERGEPDGERVKEAASHAKHAAADAGRTVIRQIKQHPVPAMLIGAGLAWLLFESDDDETATRKGYAELYSDEAAREYYSQQGGGYKQMPLLESEEAHPGPESYALPSHYLDDENDSGGGMIQGLKEKGAHLRERGAELKEKARRSMTRARQGAAEHTEEWRERAAEMGSEWKHQAEDAYHEGVEKFKQTADEHPLAVGVGFLALGVLAGILIPSTRKENEIVGPTRDRLVERTREAASEAVERGKHVAESVVAAARHEAEEQGLTPEHLKHAGSRVLESVKTVAREEGISPEALKEKARAVSSEAKNTASESTQKQAQEFKSNV